MNRVICAMLCLVVFTVTIGESSITPCPTACSCENIICRRRRGSKKLICSGVAVNCARQSLTSIPDDIPLNVTGLLLSYNNIRTIDLDLFERFPKLTNLIINSNAATEVRISKNLRRLQKLSLTNNHLVTLPLKNLTKLRRLVELKFENNAIQDIRYIYFPRKLEILNLNSNDLRSLSSGTFSKLKFLRVLKLNSNNIDRINSKAFKQLPLLENLELENNKLRQLHRDVFALLPNGWYINLKNNSISEIHHLSFRLFGYKNLNHHQVHLENNKLHFVERKMLALFVSRKTRYSFYFAGNPIFCDCNLINFRDEVRGLLQDTSKMICDSPEAYVSTDVYHLQIEDCCF